MKEPGVEIKVTTCSRDALGRFLKEEEEDESSLHRASTDALILSTNIITWDL